MVQRKMMSNMEIYNIANGLIEGFRDTNITLPVKANFYFQKNMNSLIEMAQDIDKSRVAIFEKYGTLDEENNQYKFDPAVTDDVNRELQDLFDLEQEVKVNLIELDWFDNVELTAQQMAAITYMIKDDDEDAKDE